MIALPVFEGDRGKKHDHSPMKMYEITNGKTRIISPMILYPVKFIDEVQICGNLRNPLHGNQSVYENLSRNL